ncbi:hypothetical protein [Rubritalea tangerina]
MFSSKLENASSYSKASRIMVTSRKLLVWIIISTKCPRLIWK